MRQVAVVSATPWPHRALKKEMFADVRLLRTIDQGKYKYVEIISAEDRGLLKWLPLDTLGGEVHLVPQATIFNLKCRLREASDRRL